MPNPQGVRAKDYTVVPRTLIFALHNNKILLLKGAENKRLWAGVYNGIGGHVHRGEDAATAARREFREETGLELDALWLCGTVLIDTGRNPGVLLFVFRAYVQNAGEPQPSEEGHPQWIPVSDIHTYPLVEDLHILLPKILSWNPGDPVFHALYTYDDAGRLCVRIST